MIHRWVGLISILTLCFVAARPVVAQPPPAPVDTSKGAAEKEAIRRMAGDPGQKEGKVLFLSLFSSAKIVEAENIQLKIVRAEANR